MVYLLGAGSAFPSTQISDGFLDTRVPCDVGASAALQRSGVRTRRSVLTEEVIASSLSGNLIARRQAALVSPTGLAVEAVREALARSSIKPEEVGLLVADSATPFQTCPSEAQRIGGALGLKIPAYDQVGGVGALSLFLNTVHSWRSDRLPKYSVWVSTNTPTLHVDYDAAPVAARLLGDGAAAMVISSQVVGPITIVASKYEARRRERQSFAIPHHIIVDGDTLHSPAHVHAFVKTELQEAARYRTDDRGTIYVLGPQVYRKDVEVAASDCGVQNVVPVDAISEFGFSLGTSSMSSLARLWGQFRAGDLVVVLDLDDANEGVCVLAVSR